VLKDGERIDGNSSANASVVADAVPVKVDELPPTPIDSARRGTELEDLVGGVTDEHTKGSK
jgi:hypothetical protein